MRTGTKLVVGLLLAGAGAGVVSVSYWSRWGVTPATQPAPGSAPTTGTGEADRAAMAAELGRLQEAMLQAASAKQSGAMLPAAREFTRKHPDYAPGWLFLSSVLLANGQGAEAYEQLERSLSLDPLQPEAQLNAGTIAFQLGRWEAARKHYEAAVGQRPGDAKYRLCLGQVELRTQQYDAARDQALAALRVDSNNADGYALLADVYAAQNKLAMAVDQARKALERTPADQAARLSAYTRKLAMLLKRDHQAQDALLVLRRLSPEEKMDPAVIEEMAGCWMLMGKPGEAAAEYERALQVSMVEPALTDWRLAEGATRYRLKAGDTDAARRHLEILRRLQPAAPTIEGFEKQLGK